ncbi:MAG: hypothetical protein OEL88_15115 [Sterolibacteriaceae bacterium MAG5]|nr:hypothetical protein [Candidatus Nitricoxidireducens bremensis]
MCLTGPAWAQLGVTALQTALQYSAADTAANTQEGMIQAGYEQERTQTNRQYEQINQQSQEDKSQRFREHLIDQGHIRAVSAESGLAGLSQERIAAEETNNAATDLATIEANRVRQAEQAHSQAVSKMSQAGLQLASIRRPSLLGAGLQIAGAAAGAYASSQQPDEKKGR